MSVRRLLEPYGEEPRQIAEWFLPDREGPPLVILVHGGFWRPVWGMDLEEPTALDLAAHGFAVVSLEYRSYENAWPSALIDVAAGIDQAIDRAPLHGVDPARRALLGHSAGGGLALWAASRRSLAGDAPGADPSAPAFDIVVCHAPVACLEIGSREHLGEGAIDTFMGGRPEDVPQRYAACDPHAHLPAPGTRLVLLHGDADEDVPMSQSEAYVARVTAHGIDAELVPLPGQGHYEILDPASEVSGLRRNMLVEALRP